MLGTGCWIPDVGYWILDTGCLMLDTGYWGQDFLVEGLELIEVFR